MGFEVLGVGDELGGCGTITKYVAHVLFPFHQFDG